MFLESVTALCVQQELVNRILATVEVLIERFRGERKERGGTAGKAHCGCTGIADFILGYFREHLPFYRLSVLRWLCLLYFLKPQILSLLKHTWMNPMLLVFGNSSEYDGLSHFMCKEEIEKHLPCLRNLRGHCSIRERALGALTYESSSDYTVRDSVQTNVFKTGLKYEHHFKFLYDLKEADNSSVCFIICMLECCNICKMFWVLKAYAFKIHYHKVKGIIYLQKLDKLRNIC